MDLSLSLLYLQPWWWGILTWWETSHPMSEKVNSGLSFLASNFFVPFLSCQGPCCYLICSSQFLSHSFVIKPGVGSVAFSCPCHQPRASDIDKRHPRWASNFITPQLWAAGNDTASRNPKLTSPLIYPFRVLAVQCSMLFFSTDPGQFVANFP